MKLAGGRESKTDTCWYLFDLLRTWEKRDWAWGHIAQQASAGAHATSSTGPGRKRTGSHRGHGYGRHTGGPREDQTVAGETAMSIPHRIRFHHYYSSDAAPRESEAETDTTSVTSYPHLFRTNRIQALQDSPRENGVNGTNPIYLPLTPRIQARDPRNTLSRSTFRHVKCSSSSRNSNPRARGSWHGEPSKNETSWVSVPAKLILSSSLELNGK